MGPSQPIIDRRSEIREQILQMGRQASRAARQLAILDASAKNTALNAMARGIRSEAESIKRVNSGDIEAGRKAGLPDAMIDRLLLDDARVEAMAAGLEQIARLPDPIGEDLKVIEHANGMSIHKTRAPLGVVAMVYESRPNVTADAAALCFKAGNAVILRGGSEAMASNRAILDAMLGGRLEAGAPEHAIQLVPTTDREAVNALLQMDEHIDLIIPRGGEGLIRAVAEHSRVPVLKHYKGVVHVYVDCDADLDMAQRIAMNAKVQRPGVCNAMETLLVHEAVADEFLPRIGRALLDAGVEIRGDDPTCALIAEAKPASAEDWPAEYLDLIVSVGVVSNLDAAIDHIARHGSQHTDVIVTDDASAAERFAREVDSATVYINASSRFTDGFEFGMGAEIGISTDKLHARGPCGLEELTTYKYVIRGSGQVRE